MKVEYDWKKVGKNEKGEIIYYNYETKEYAVEKDFRYLVKPEKKDLEEIKK